MNQYMDYPAPSQREHDLELAGYERWQREQQAKLDPWFPILGKPPHAPTWHLEWQALRDQMAAAGSGDGWSVVTVAADGQATVTVSADVVTIALRTVGAGA